MPSPSASRCAGTIAPRWPSAGPAAPCSSSTTSRRSPRSWPATWSAPATRRDAPPTGPRRSAAAEQRPDLVVLDLMLPGLDGLEVMRRLRERRRGEPDRGDPADRQGRGVRPRRRAAAAAPTTTSSSRSRRPSWSRGSTRCCGASTPAPDARGAADRSTALGSTRPRAGCSSTARRSADPARVRPARCSSPATRGRRSRATS